MPSQIQEHREFSIKPAPFLQNFLKGKTVIFMSVCTSLAISKTKFHHLSHFVCGWPDHVVKKFLHLWNNKLDYLRAVSTSLWSLGLLRWHLVQGQRLLEHSCLSFPSPLLAAWWRCLELGCASTFSLDEWRNWKQANSILELTNSNNDFAASWVLYGPCIKILQLWTLCQSKLNWCPMMISIHERSKWIQWNFGYSKFELR